MKKKLFLIGGSGFIGKNLVKSLHERYEIYVYDKFIDYTYFTEYPDVRLSQIELDKDTIPEEVESPDYIINLASIVTAERDLTLFDGMIASNLKVLINLYERFKCDSKLVLFIQFGSSEEYGNEGSPFNETIREEPGSPYALVKQLTTNTAMMLFRNYGFPITVIRPGNLYGPLQGKTKFIPYVIDCLLKNKTLNVTLCNQKRDFIFVDDFAWCIEKLLGYSSKCKGQIINVANGKSVELKAIIETAKEITGSKSVVNYGAKPYRENEAMDLRCSIEKFISLTECSESYEGHLMKSLENGIRETIDWMRSVQ